MDGGGKDWSKKGPIAIVESPPFPCGILISAVRVEFNFTQRNGAHLDLTFMTPKDLYDIKTAYAIERATHNI